MRLYLADLEFGLDGTPSISPDSSDIGTWGAFDTPTAVVPKEDQLIASFSVTAPEGAEPGDHVGVVVAEGEPIESGEGRAIGIVKRVATRLYATVPGDARRDLTIERVQIEKNSTFFPTETTLRITLRNSGRVRLEPTVAVNGTPAQGPDLIMSKSVEEFIATQPIPFWGGSIGFRVDATTRTSDGGAGPIRQARVSTFVIPIHLLVLILLTAVLVVFGRWWWSKRGTKYDSIQSDIKRIERLLAMQAAGGAGTPRQKADPEAAIRAALKQARRAGNTDAEGKLQEKLDQVTAAKAGGSGALEAILRELSDAPPSQRKALVRAARAFGPAALQKQTELVNGLPQEVQIELTAQKPSAQTQKPPKKKRSKRP